MPKNEVLCGESMLNDFLNISIASSNIKKIIVNKREMLPQLHIIMYGSIGSGKSTITREIGSMMNVPVVNHFTKAHIYGSIDEKTGVLIEPLIWESRNSCLCVDEFHFKSNDYSDVDMMSGLLDVMVSQKVSKKVGYRCNDYSEKDDDLFLTVSKSRITCKTRFACIINTMTDMSSVDSQMMKALKSRCIVIPHYPKIDEYFQLIRGRKRFFVYKKYKVNSIIRVKDADFNIIVDFAEKNMTNSDSVLRCIDDMTRCFAITKTHNEILYKKILLYHSA